MVAPYPTHVQSGHTYTCTVHSALCTLHMWWPLSSPHTRCSPPPGPGHSGGLCREGGEPCWDMVRRSEHWQRHIVCTLTCATCPHLVCTITHSHLALTHMCRELEMRYPWVFVNILCWPIFFVSRIRVHYTGLGVTSAARRTEVTDLNIIAKLRNSTATPGWQHRSQRAYKRARAQHLRASYSARKLGIGQSEGCKHDTVWTGK